MIEIIPAIERHFQDFGWLKTFWLFSFDQYFDPKNVNFGLLRVFNDDVIEANSGFPMHSHAEMEIITVVFDGELTHEDSCGGNGTITAGEIQVMTAGTGISHSEFNYGKKPVHLFQIWIQPNKRDLKPDYRQMFSNIVSGNALQKIHVPKKKFQEMQLIASHEKHETALQLNADANVFLAKFEKSNEIECRAEFEKTFIYVIGGKISINGKLLEQGFQARISVEKKIQLKALQKSEFLLIDVSD